MTDGPEGPAEVTPEEDADDFIHKLLEACRYISSARRSQEGGASSSKLFDEPEKDKKTPKKKREPNKKVEALKKRAANERAKYLKTVQERRDLELAAKLEKREKLAQKRKSLMQKDEEIIQMLKKKINKETDQ